MTGGQVVVEVLKQHGVDTVFGIPGMHSLPVYDALIDEPGIRHVLARHEQGAAFMANGYARATSRPGVVLTTTGPAACNAMAAVADAYRDSVPVLQEFYDPRTFGSPLHNACGWALHQFAGGGPWKPAGRTREANQVGWFLEPIEY